MKQVLFLLFFGLFMVHLINGQVKIGDNPQSLDGASILELESTDKVLVITRVNTVQMNALFPLSGALVYNTDLQSVHYFDGLDWVNIGGGGGTGGPLTADPIVNDISTIVITPTGTGDNLEVAENSIGTTQIRDFSINGTEDILDGSIGTGKFGEDVITQFELSENSVGPIELDNANIGVSAFANDVGYITSANVVSADGDNALQIGTDSGAYYDETPLLDAIQDNADAIAADNDQSPSNEIQNLTLTGSVIGLTDTGGTIDIGPLVSGGGSDNQNIGPVTFNTTTNELSIGIEDGNPGTVDLTPLTGGGGSTEVADQSTITGVGTAGDPFKIEPGGNGQFLTTNASGAVAWATVNPGGGGTTEVVDGTLLTGAGTAGDPFTIAPGGANQILRTNAAGDAVAWVPLPTGSAVISDDTLEGDGSSAGTALGLADEAVTLEKIAPNGATTDGQIIQWNTDINGDGSGGGWELGDPLAISGTADHIFFADKTTGEPVVSANGGLLWDAAARFNTGALFVGLDGFTQNKSTEAKIQILEDLNGQLAYPLQIQNRGTEIPATASAVGILFAVERGGNFGKGSLVYERMTSTGSGDFHFLQDTDNDNTNPALDTDKAFTITEDKDIRLYRGIDIDGVGFGNAGQVLASGGFENALQWVNPSGLAAGTNEWDIVTWEPDAINPAAGSYVSSAPQSIKLDVGGNKLDLLYGDAATVNSSILLDNSTLEAANDGTNDVIRIKPAQGTLPLAQDQILVTDKDTGEVNWEPLSATGGETNTASNLGAAGIGPFINKNGVDLRFKNINGLDANIITVTDDVANNEIDLDIRNGSIPFTKLEPATPTAPTQVEQILVSSADGTSISWQPKTSGSTNLSTDNLTQDTGEDRTYNLNGQNLVFTGLGSVGIGNGASTPTSKLHVAGEVRVEGIKSADGTIGNPAFAFQDDTDQDTGFYRPFADAIGFTVGGNNAITISEPSTGVTKVTIDDNIELDGTLTDINDEVGTNGQVLSSTVTGVDWVDIPEGPAHKAKIPNSAEISASSGEHGVTFPVAMANNQYIINLTVEEVNAGNPIFINVVNQTAAGFTVRITEFDGTTLNTVPTATWHYTVHNP